MMKALVTVKRVLDSNIGVRVKANGSGVETHGVKHVMNPFDEMALEEAIRLREKGCISELVVLSIGGSACQETLRQALALGADRAILVTTEQILCPLSIAKILRFFVLHEQPNFVLMGRQSVDGDHQQTPQMLAGLLHWPQAISVSQLEIHADYACVTREIDGGQEKIEVLLPAIFSADLRLNTLRYISLPLLMKAKQKPLTMVALDDLSLPLRTHTQVIATAQGSLIRKVQKIDSVHALIDKLKHEACVL